MPNWCNNNITVRGSNQAEIQRLVSAFKEGKFCDAVIPVPQELMDTMAGSYGDDEKQRALEAQEQANITKFGCKNWYDFCTSRWGTKWDIGDEHSIQVDNDGLGFTASFDSAWAPPMGVVEELSAQGLQVTLCYYEPGMAFVGKFEDGEDFCYDYSGHNSNTVRDVIGDELDDMFGISEAMAEYEAENEEELTEWIKDGKEKLGLVAG